MTELTFECVIDRELYEFSDKKYINIAVDETTVQKNKQDPVHIC